MNDVGGSPKAGDPYRPPTEVGAASRPRSPYEVINVASFLWFALSAKVVVAGYYLRPIFEDFDVELPTLTLCLLHPMASVFFLATAGWVIVASLTMNDRVKRNHFGRIALSLAAIAIVISFLGFASPLLSLFNNLS